MNSITVNTSAEIQAVLNYITNTDLSVLVDTRPLQPFGTSQHYQNEPVIEVTELFTTQKFLHEVDSEGYGMDIPMIIKWLAIVNHYGFDRAYDVRFLHLFRPYVEKSLLQIFRYEAFGHDRKGVKPRMFNGKTYSRKAFVDAFLCFFEKHGFAF